MMVAHDSNGNRIEATPKATAICPVCQGECFSKCGEIKTWHWAHKSLKECDTWYEPEGEWHYGWKKLAGLENTEIVIKKDGGIHRADIRTDRGLVVELQHSPLAPKDVRDREAFYGNMIWVIDGTEVLKDFRIERWISKEGSYYFKHHGKTNAWINEIKAPRYYHFSQIAFHTYYWQNHYLPEYSGVGASKEVPVSRPPVLKWKRTNREGRAIILEDILVEPNEEYCKLISKSDFVRQHFGAAIKRKQDSLFDF